MHVCIHYCHQCLLIFYVSLGKSVASVLLHFLSLSTLFSIFYFSHLSYRLTFDQLRPSASVRPAVCCQSVSVCGRTSIKSTLSAFGLAVVNRRYRRAFNNPTSTHHVAAGISGGRVKWFASRDHTGTSTRAEKSFDLPQIEHYRSNTVPNNSLSQKI